MNGVDLGIDLTRDLFISISFILTGLFMLGHSLFKAWFAILYFLSGVLLFILNAITVPLPPANAGLFDMGPIIALLNITLSGYLIWLGLKLKNNYFDQKEMIQHHIL